MELLGCQNADRDDSKMIEMYDRDTMFEHMKRKQLNDAIKNTTDEVTNKVTKEVTKDIAINMIKENMDIDLISKITGLSIEEINKLKKN